MKNKKSSAKTFENMGYRKVQRKNSRNRKLLTTEHQKWLKDNGYRNIGWDNVINLYQKIAELQSEERIDNLDLEELFLEADRIGNKYLSSEEIRENEQKLAREVNQIADIIDSQFPDNTLTVVDYSNHHKQSKKSRRIIAK